MGIRMKDEKLQGHEVGEILQLWNKTYGLTKIFSPDHENVRNFTSQLYARLKDFLREQSYLEIGIQEFSFTFAGKTVYFDDQAGSLPFFFFKDGMASLYFSHGLRKKEFNEFLDICKRESSLPPEESDIVSAFWERDFVNIRYFAPDEFLESQIGQDVESVEYVVDREDLYTGSIELDPEDQKALFAGIPMSECIGEIGLGPQNETTPPTEAMEGSPEAAALLSLAENAQLEQMLMDNRKASPDQEIISLLLELLYLEDEPLRFERTLDVLLECHNQFITEGDFGRADDVLSSLDELKNSLHPDQSEKRALLDAFHNKLQIEVILSNIQAAYEQARVHNYESLFRYLKRIGPKALPLAGYLFSETKSPRYQEMARGILKNLGKDAPVQLLDLAQKNQPELTLEILEIAAERPDVRTLSRLAGFLSWPHPEIRKSAIRALGKLQGARSAKLLLAYLQDTDADIRTLAIRNLAATKDEAALSRILETTQEKLFHQLNQKEKLAYIEALAASGSPAAFAVLSSLIRDVRRFARGRIVETGDLVIAALGQASDPQALIALEAGSRSFHPKLKKRSKEMLGRAR